MLYVSSELSKITRDYARIENAETLSKSKQYYKEAYGVILSLILIKMLRR